MGKAPKNLLIGQAGVWRVASMLAVRGFNPHIPGVDFGYDLLLDAGVRIQVKASHLVKTNGKRGTISYVFRTMKPVQAIGYKKQLPIRKRTFSDECEFVVFWGIDQDRFWVVPSLTVDNASAVIVGLNPYWQDIDIQHGQALVDSGMSVTKAAEQLGVSFKTLDRRLKGEYVTPNRTMALAVQKCENRWDLIESCINHRLEVATLETMAEIPFQEVRNHV